MDCFDVLGACNDVVADASIKLIFVGTGGWDKNFHSNRSAFVRHSDQGSRAISHGPYGHAPSTIVRVACVPRLCSNTTLYSKHQCMMPAAQRQRLHAPQQHLPRPPIMSQSCSARGNHMPLVKGHPARGLPSRQELLPVHSGSLFATTAANWMSAESCSTQGKLGAAGTLTARRTGQGLLWGSIPAVS